MAAAVECPPRVPALCGVLAHVCASPVDPQAPCVPLIKVLFPAKSAGGH
jgi:hypothetical protein